jgi:LPXTG-site transpeptidase (sortase) family protein
MVYSTRLARALAACAVAASLAAAPTPSLAAPSPWLELDGNIRATDPTPAGIHDWANSGAASPINACPAVPGVVNMSGSGGLFNCGSPGAGSAPPNPPTLTAAATADSTIVSTLFVVDPLSSDTTTSCGAGDDTVLGGGLKNGDDINSFAFSPGNVPAKDDLMNIYAASRIRADGHHELFFAAERLANNGDSHMDFEFMQSKVTRTAGCSGTLSGHRTEGDLLLAVDFTNGGSLAGDTLYRWHCNADPGPQPADGTICDPGGSTPNAHYELTSALPGTLTFLVNAVVIPCGGWVCRDSGTGNSTQIDVNDFMEGGIDLAVLPFTGCFNTLLPHTRTAQSFTSGLKDFSGPDAFHTCRAPTVTQPGLPNTGLVGPDGPLSLMPLTAEPVARPAAPPRPSRLSIPRLGINAPVERLGLDSQGNLAAPSALKDVAWYAGGPAPGEPGGAIISGHLGVRPGQAVFWDLGKIRRGDSIVVTRRDGTRVTFIVDGARTYARNAKVPALFSSDGTSELWLITCSGRWDYGRSTYDDRLVVHARVVETVAAPSTGTIPPLRPRLRLL